MRDAGHRTPDIGQRTSDGEKSKNNISTPQGGGHNSCTKLGVSSSGYMRSRYCGQIREQYRGTIVSQIKPTLPFKYMCIENFYRNKLDFMYILC